MKRIAVLSGGPAAGGSAAILERTTPSVRAEVRPATSGDVDAIHALIADNLAVGHLLPRDRAEIATHVARFVVVTDGDDVLGCADLAPLGADSAEIRSLVVASHVRARGLGRMLLREMIERATAAGIQQLCAFTHAPGCFLKAGFSIVPHTWVPEKIQKDCHSCSQFRHCGQYAVMLPLVRSTASCVPLASLHG